MAVSNRRRGGGPRALAASVSRVTKPIFGKRGFAEGSILNDWSAIIGPQLAAHCSPQKIAFPPGKRDGGTLHLCIDSGSLATELQHLEPQLIEKINGFFGYRAVDRVRIVQGMVTVVEAAETPRPPAVRPPLEAEEEEELARGLTEIKDAELRSALERLGRAVIAGEKK